MARHSLIQGLLPHPWFLLSLFSCPTMPNSLWPHGLQHIRLPCPSLSPRVCSNLCPLSWWYHPITLPPFPLALNLSKHKGLFQWLSSLHQMAKYWSFTFSISLSNEYSRLISFRIDWFDLHAVQGTIKKSSPALQFKSINYLSITSLLLCTWPESPLVVDPDCSRLLSSQE